MNFYTFLPPTQHRKSAGLGEAGLLEQVYFQSLTVHLTLGVEWWVGISSRNIGRIVYLLKVRPVVQDPS